MIYPAHWEADVVLRDGSTAVVRPIHADDADRLVAFYGRVSDRSKYLRFFAPYPRLSERDVRMFTEVDYVDRVALILTVADEMIGVGRYDRIDPGEAEVAFLVEDSHQGRGVGSVLLEHLAQVARENGITRFRAEVLPENRRMLGVFEEGGYQVSGGIDDGIVGMALAIEPTQTSLEVTRAREHRAEARSVERILTPRSVAVIGASRHRDKIGQTLVRNLVLGGFTGPVYAVNPAAPAVAGVPAYPSVARIPDQVDLAIVAVPAESVLDVVRECAGKGVHGLVVVSSGFAETGSEGRQRQRELVRTARAYGLRVIGPNALGVINANPAVSLNASLALAAPPPGRVGFFCQSGALGTVIVQTVANRGLGLSTFVSAGNRADVSGNDVMQYWIDDANTEVVLLYLESIGNPRKFSRIARQLSHRKPVVAVRSGRFTQGVPLGHTVSGASVPRAAVDAMFAQAGVIQVDTLDAMLDVAQILTYQPVPGGTGVMITGNSDALLLLAADAAVEAGLRLVHDPEPLAPEAAADEFASVLDHALADPAVHAVVVVYVPPVDSAHAVAVADAIARATRTSTKPVVATFLGAAGVPEPLRRYAPNTATDAAGESGTGSTAGAATGRGAVRGSIPSFSAPEAAVRALAKVAEYAEWRRRPAGQVPDLEDLEPARARAVLDEVLTRAKGSDGSGGGETGTGETSRADSRDLSTAETSALLGAYGIHVWTEFPVGSVAEAIAAGADLGWDVVLKAAAPHLRQRPDLADVWRNIDDAETMRAAWESMTESMGQPSEHTGSPRFVVQKMAPRGVPVRIGCVEDRLFGPIVSFGVAGVATELLDDVAYRIPPLTDVEAGAMVRSVRAAPLLFGHRGGERVDVAAVEDLIHRVARLTYDLPEVASAELSPVLAGPDGVAVLGAVVRAEPAGEAARTDWYARRLTRY